MDRYNRYVFDFRAAEPDEDILQLVRQLEQALQGKEQVRNLRLAVVKYRPAPAPSQPIWVRLPQAAGGDYHAVNMGGVEKHEGMKLTADMLRDLQQRGVCTELLVEGPAPDMLRMRGTGSLDGAHQLVGSHGFAITANQRGLTVTLQDRRADQEPGFAAPEYGRPDLCQVWACIRMPV